MFSFAVDEYVKIGSWEFLGQWGVSSGSKHHHTNFFEAKRHCTLAGNCFGVMTGAFTGHVYSINFPILLTSVGSWYINKKEIISSNIIYQDCVLVINAFCKLKYDTVQTF